MNIYLGADHNGFALKEKVFAYLAKQKYDVQDVGDNKDCVLGNVMVYMGSSNYSTHTGAKNSGFIGGATTCEIHIPKV